jgi:hypothetical protein
VQEAENNSDRDKRDSQNGVARHIYEGVAEMIDLDSTTQKQTINMEGKVSQ